jgi:hypothetical protein
MLGQAGSWRWWGPPATWAIKTARLHGTDPPGHGRRADPIQPANRGVGIGGPADRDRDVRTAKTLRRPIDVPRQGQTLPPTYHTRKPPGEKESQPNGGGDAGTEAGTIAIRKTARS